MNLLVLIYFNGISPSVAFMFSFKCVLTAEIFDYNFFLVFFLQVIVIVSEHEFTRSNLFQRYFSLRGIYFFV